jgi:hypothetical protein
LKIPNRRKISKNHYTLTETDISVSFLADIKKGNIMPAYNFKKQFASLVERGEKRQTLRLPRKRPTKAGERLKLYTGMRTKQCRLLLEVVCRSVTPVTIDNHSIFMDGKRLDVVDSVRFAKADGFERIEDFIEFFHNQYGFPVYLELIKW